MNKNKNKIAKNRRAMSLFLSLCFNWARRTRCNLYWCPTWSLGPFLLGQLKLWVYIRVSKYALVLIFLYMFLSARHHVTFYQSHSAHTVYICTYIQNSYYYMYLGIYAYGRIMANFQYSTHYFAKKHLFVLSILRVGYFSELKWWKLRKSEKTSIIIRFMFNSPTKSSSP